MDVAEIKRDSLDSADERVEEVYYRNPPRYAIYRTRARVMVHFADASQGGAEAKQRTDLAQVNPLRGEIDGLLDDWRGGDGPDAAAAARSDRRLADALALALENDLPNAALYLAALKADIDRERASRARRFYVIFSAGTAALLLLVAALLDAWAPSMRGVSDVFRGDIRSLMVAAGAGAIGAFFSVALAIRDRTPLNDLRLLDTIVDAVLRIVIGFVGGMVLYALFRTQVVSSIAFGDDAARLKPVPAAAGVVSKFDWLLVAVVGFVAGFVERLVGNLLAKSSLVAGVAAPLPPGPPAPPGPGDDGVPPNQAGDEGAAADDPAATPGADGCDVPFDPAQTTEDEELPAATGGLEPDVVEPEQDAGAELAGDATDDAAPEADGCDAKFDPADAMPDEALPAASGGVEGRD